MNARQLLLPLVIMSLQGCAMMGPELVQPTTSFNYDETAQLMRPGHAIIEGSALIRQQGGGVVSCAGNEVNALPATRYAQERMFIVYGNDMKGFRQNSAAWGQRAPADPPPAYFTLSHKAVCDAQGNFQFKNVAAGTYYVVTRITWRVPGRYTEEGGALMQRVTVTETDIIRIVLSP
jgi:hypothetical protein